MRFIKSLVLALLIGLVGCQGAAGAATTPQQPLPQGIALTPAIQDKVLGPQEKSVEFKVQLTNQDDRPVTFALGSTDFTSLNQTGGLTFLGSDSRRVTSGNGLSSLLQLEAKQVTIQPDVTREITARIPDVSTLAPGGHYVAITAQALPDGTATKGNKVSVNQVVSSLVFLETAGQGTKTLELLKPELSRLSFSLPDRLNLVFKATGNTQTTPRGVATISNGDSIRLQGVINENSSLLLPKSTRLLPTELNGDRRPFWPGIYTVRVQYRYQGSLGITTVERKVLYLNGPMTALTAAVIVLLVALLLRNRRLVWQFIQGKPVLSVKNRRRFARASRNSTVVPTPTPEAPKKRRKLVQ